ncbi:MAG: 30S ribosomal protein S6 [Candidatus Omnitrophota bacterium]|jgi:small subunit ribosomal protein S6
MNKYEAMFITKPDLSDEERKSLFAQIQDAVIKNNGEITQAAVWGERRKLTFPIKKSTEGVYYLMNFSVAPGAIVKIKEIYKLNENILRLLVSVLGKA